MTTAMKRHIQLRLNISPWTAFDINHHEMARQFMDNNTPANTLSLDEWLAEYGDKLPNDVIKKGYELLSMFSGYGGDT